jgi:Fungal protein kinase
MSGVPKLIAYHAGASTKDFGNPSSEIKRMFLKLKAADTISISESSYATSQQGIVSINPNNDNSLDDISPDDDSTDEQVFRQQRWILISYCGASIDDEGDPTISDKPFTTVDRLRALRSVICTISKLFCEKRIMHRDISANNIRIAPASDSNHSAGNLIDFDMAGYWGAGGSGAKSRTGTPLYMAVNILCPQKPLKCHLPWYDIESVFWVLLIGEGKRSGVKIDALTGTNLEALGHSKFYVVSHYWPRIMKRAFMQGLVGKLICRLRGFLFDRAWTSTKEYDDNIWLNAKYEADRFKKGNDDDDEEERGNNMADALKEGVKNIVTWFDECINELLASENSK